MIKKISLSLLIFLMTIFSAHAENSIPMGLNRTKEFLDDFFQPGLLKNQLYTLDWVDAGASQGIVTRKQLESGNKDYSVAVFRFGNHKAKGGSFPSPTWATIEIERYIWEYIYIENGFDPDLPDENLTPKQRDLKNSLIRQCREELVGYTPGEQRRIVLKAWEEREKELGRPLERAEKDKIKTEVEKRAPVFDDPQVDETEGIAIVNGTNIYDVYKIFTDRDQYSRLLSDNFLFSHVITSDELKRRSILLNPHEQLFFSWFHMAAIDIDDTTFNEGKINFNEVTLNRPEGKVKTVIPNITVAWTIDPRFWTEKYLSKNGREGKFDPIRDAHGNIIGHNGKFGNRDVYVMDGYLELEPYTSKDENGFESIDEARVLAIYHTYMRVEKDTTSFPPDIRESYSRGFMKKMISIVNR